MLMTSSMRQAALDRRIDQYKYCIIRLHFHPKYIIQAVFKPRETGI